MKRSLGIGIVVLAVMLIACTSSEGTTGGGSGPLRVVATTTVLGDIASAIAGGDLDVETLMPPGADPHDFKPSSAQVALIDQADLVIANGLGLEEGLADVLEGAEADDVNVLEVGPLIDPIPFGESTSTGECDPDAAHAEEEDHEGAAGSCDPHFWNDPDRAATAAEVIGEALNAIDPSVDWAERASAYADELRELGEEIETILQPIPPAGRKLVTNHDALGYFARRYGFEVVGVVIPGGSTLAEPSSVELANLVEVMEDENVRAIFAETISPTALAEAVAAEIGDDVEVVELYTDSLGPPGSGAETLLKMLRLDADRIAAALT